MKYKIAHFADVHWRGLSRHDEYKRAFRDAFKTMKDEKVDAIVIVGDIVHSKTQGISPELIDCLCWWFRSLVEIAPTYVTLGNHDGLIMNKDREDAISPIIRALDLPRLKLIKNSESFEHGELLFSNFSCFDEKSWDKLGPDPKKINVALYHGAVRGSKTDIDWELDGEVDVGLFQGFDFVLLGDIHKSQYLDEESRVAYCGSSIQQNYGETPDKGFMIWSIDSKDEYESKHYRIKHDRPFHTVSWKGTVPATLDAADEFPDYSRFRIKTDIPISQGEIKQLYSSLKEFKFATEIVMKHDSAKQERSMESLENSAGKILNLNDPSVIAKMILEYYAPAGLSDRMNQKLEELVHKFWKFANDSDRSPGIRWNLRNIEFSNTFGYGKDNYINIESLDGITGVFGQNRIGKSSICGTLMYSLFNTTDRGAISNLHIINTRKGHCSAKAVVSKGGKNYLIERQSVKKQNRAGKVSAVTHLNLHEIDDDGKIISDMCGEQRRDTEKTIREIVGTPEDFLLTSLASQGEMSNFLKQKASSRKTVLSKFLELDIFERLNSAARDESIGLKHALKNIPNRDYDIVLLDLKNRLEVVSKDRENTFEELEKKRNSTRELELSLATRGDCNLVTAQDITEQEHRLGDLSDRIKEYTDHVSDASSKFDSLTEQVDRIAEFKKSFPIEDLSEMMENQDQLEIQLRDLNHRIDKEKQSVKSFKKEAEKLNDVPCDDNCPINKYTKSAKKAKREIVKRELEIQSLKSDVSAAKKSLNALLKKDLKGKFEKFNEVVGRFNDLSLEKSRVELDLSENKNKLDRVLDEFLIQEQNLDEMKANVSTDSAAEQIRELRQKLNQYKKTCIDLEGKYSSLSEKVGLLHSEIANTKQQKAEFEKANEEWRVFELFMNATSKNGIPLEVIRSRLPEINQEISSILQGVTGFTVELESDDGSNAMNIYINYGDSRRIIECCSGMEKMMASIAIRVALTNVSSLPKANILIIDEGFGALDSGNIEACSRFLESLKKWFSCILIISHVDAIKDAVDNTLEIQRIGPDAKIYVK